MYSILNTLVLFKCWLVPSVINLIFEQNIIYFIETLNIISISIESTDVVSCHCYDSIQKIGKNFKLNLWGAFKYNVSSRGGGVWKY